jgi:hypothetical protein
MQIIMQMEMLMTHDNADGKLALSQCSLSEVGSLSEVMVMLTMMQWLKSKAM